MEENVKATVTDNTKVAESVSEHIKFETLRNFLVKPLDPVMVKKEFSKPVPNDKQPVKDENGIEATDYDKVETEIKEVESDYRRGIVIKVPVDYQRAMNDEKFPATPIHVGDTILYKESIAKWFDQLKDSQIIDIYSVFAIEK